MSRVAVAGIFDLPAQVRNEALIEAKPLIEGAYTEKGCIHYLWTADLNHPGRIVVYEECENSKDLGAYLKSHWYKTMSNHPISFSLVSAETNKLRIDIKEAVYLENGIPTGYFRNEFK